ncbi:MAG: TetR/AcrR family transcriptional regulator C-terminal domain-containing protein [Bacilli bacterium]|nr:TetR/AcrR family transcriptional regulator C-terminal domain-containing protein [Bacilli bacterium]
MNTANNKRKKESQLKIERIFLELIQTREIEEISVTDICKEAGLNRTTFYSNYIDIYDLADKIRQKLEDDVMNLYMEDRDNKHNSTDFLKLLKHIYENQIFYNTYFKLGFDKSSLFNEYDYKLAAKLFNDKHIDYHIEFFKAGFNAILKKWLYSGCKESPEEVFEIIQSEYKKDLNLI